MNAPGKKHPLVRFVTDPLGFAKDVAGRIWDALDGVLPVIIPVGSAVAVIIVGACVTRRIRAARLRRHARRVKILVPPEVAPSGAQTLWMGLHAILRPGWRRLLQGQPHVSCEIAAEPDRITFYLWVPAIVPPGLVERAIESSWPGARADVMADDDAVLHSAPALATSELVLAEPEWFPIGDVPDDDPLRRLEVRFDKPSHLATCRVTIDDAEGFSVLPGRCRDVGSAPGGNRTKGATSVACQRDIRHSLR